MIAIITGDIIHSECIAPSKLMKVAKAFLGQFGKTPKKWEIYRGDQFQLEIEDAANAFWVCCHFKAVIKKLQSVDVRMAIGLGQKEYTANRLSQCNGTAFVRSGRKFDVLKKEQVNLAVSSDNEDFDTDMNLYFRFASLFMDQWSVVSAEIIDILMASPHKNQTEIAELLGINQSSVSQRIKRANFDLLTDLNERFKAGVKRLSL